ncbi:glycosyltransferase [Kineothrix sp. MSJ-39]|uniref:glycosyltransferase n=1 Tax=Kineothrix sp. MSJ-39 TaxID=2841533 RepID=UPI001C121585|nr:glycosyltransferase [Kineothrix sp. MSJ-39]MBU5430648.1 glycosyltransferase [Kineothrix sp. MSJ-39]
MKTLVLSGINLFEGGPLSIFYDCLDEIIRQHVNEHYHIVAFVHKKNLFEKYKNDVELIEFQDSRDSYFKRLRYEYVYFYEYSKLHDVDVWFSLHDITPHVKANKIYTYCHNPSPFMKKDITKIKYSATNVAFSFFYKYLYRINIKSATGIIVQHNWMREEFLKMFPITNVIVARPTMHVDYEYIPKAQNQTCKTFLFASYPRYFKNFEIICEACNILKRNDFEVWFTLKGDENAYAYDLRKRYKNIKNIKWLGIQPREKVLEMYNQINYMIFPSTLESWGLPISEFKLTGKPMLLADLPYAHETLGAYDKAIFFNPYDEKELAIEMERLLDGKEKFAIASEQPIRQPFAKNWEELIHLILK